MNLPSPRLKLASIATKSIMSASLLSLGWVFFKAGLAFFGGGFVLIPVLQRQLVDGVAWLSPQEFLDGVAISNLTPGPIAVISTFVGYKMSGIAGAVIATLALFLPALVLMFVLSSLYERLKYFEAVQEFLSSLIPAVAALIAVAALQLGSKTLHHAWQFAVMTVSFILLVRFRINPLWLLLIMTVAGFLLKLS